MAGVLGAWITPAKLTRHVPFVDQPWFQHTLNQILLNEHFFAIQLPFERSAF